MDYARGEAKPAAREQVRGIWAAMTTPFDDQGHLDLPALRRDTSYLVEDLEIDGLFCAGVMAEFWALSNEERRSVVETVVDEAAGRCRVIAHTGHHSAREAIELTKHAEDAGADFAVLINPYYPRVNEAGLYDWFAEVSTAVDIGLWLFDTSYAGYGLSLELIEALADLDNICGIKVGHDHERFLEILGRVGGRIIASEPNEAKWLENMLEHGVEVFMSSAAPYLFQSVAHKPMRQYTLAALAGDPGLAEAISSSLEPVRAVSERFVTGPWRRDKLQPIAAIKEWSALLGMSGGPVRAPLRGLSSEEAGALLADLEQTGLVQARGVHETVTAAL
ncbi:MAG: dihydrodipicolinate synthase family protein [Acidimicrobiales bacterium]